MKGETQPRKNIYKAADQQFMGKGNFLDLIGHIEHNQ